MTPDGNLESALQAYWAGQWDKTQELLHSLTTSLFIQGLRALAQVRQLLDEGMAPDADVLAGWLGHLAEPFADSRLEGERHFARGWLFWLAGDFSQAEAPLAQAVETVRQVEVADITEAAYWLARVQLLLSKPAAIATFEKTLRCRSASPPAMLRFIDLLWRAGQVERAEQVWQTVRLHRQVQGTALAALCAARVLLFHEQAAAAEQVLRKAAAKGGVVQIEITLLLAWSLDAQQHYSQAADLLDHLEGPYPARALQAWRTLFHLRREPSRDSQTTILVKLQPFFRVNTPGESYFAGQTAVAQGRSEEAAGFFRQVLSYPPLRHFARFGLVCLGQEDGTEFLAGRQGFFLTAAARLRLALDRFCRRQASGGELVEQLDRADRVGYLPADAGHWRKLTDLQGRPTLTVADLQSLVQGDSPGKRRQGFILAIELAVSRLSFNEAQQLCLEWSGLDLLLADPTLRRYLREHWLVMLLQSLSDETETKSQSMLALPMLDGLGSDFRLALVRDWLDLTTSDACGHEEAKDGFARCWRAARRLHFSDTSITPGSWRKTVTELREGSPLRGLAQVLLVQEAAHRRDWNSLTRLLEDRGPWQALACPPPFIIEVLSWALYQPAPSLRRSVGKWLGTWHRSALGPQLQALALQAGVASPDPHTAEPPRGTPAQGWFLHQAAQSLRREKFREALAWLRRCSPFDEGGDRTKVEAAILDLERLARAELLAEVFRFRPEQKPVPPGLVVDAADRLAAFPEGQLVLQAADRGDWPTARQHLAQLAETGSLDAALAHHLAIVYQRNGRFLEDHGETEPADRCRHLAWRCWLTWLTACPAGDFSADGKGEVLVEHLLQSDRERLQKLLLANQIERARKLWGLIHELPRLVQGQPDLVAFFEGALARFREILTADYLTGIHEAMRCGAIPKGWRADYEKGLGALRRLLSLDPDNVRLLTTVIDLCGDFFFDCYNNEAWEQLEQGLERYTPLALKLARGGRPGDLAAGAALAEFYKFRALAEPDRAAKIALLGEALRFNPANDNVRELLHQLEEKNDQSV